MDDQILGLLGDSEYDSLELLDDVQIEGLAAFMRKNPRQARKALRKVSKPRISGRNQTSRDQMESRFSMLGKDLRQGLLKKTHQLVDGTIYNVKSVDGVKRVIFFEDDERKDIGLRNISNGKLDKNEVFLLSHIRILYGVGTSKEETATGVATVTEWREIPANMIGEINFRADGRLVFDKMALQDYVHYERNEITVQNAAGSENVGGYGYAAGQGRPGLRKLDNPKLLPTQTQLEMEIEWGAAAPEYAFLKVELIGSKVAKY